MVHGVELPKNQRKEHGNVQYHDCHCNYTTMPNVSLNHTEVCCHLACCESFLQDVDMYNVDVDINNVPFLKAILDSAWLNVIAQNITESTTETEPSDIPPSTTMEPNNITPSTTMEPNNITPSTTVAYSGSAPDRGQQDLALVASAILIYIHRRGRANVL